MKKRDLYFTILIFCCGFLSSCMSGQPLIKKKADNNTTYRVDYLFEHEGCKVYRFYDMGNYIYFTNCNGDVTSIKNDSTQIRQVTITRRQTTNP